MAEIITYVVMIFFAPLSAEPFTSVVSTRHFDSLEACTAAMPAVLAEEGSLFRPGAVEGVACMTEDMAGRLIDIQDSMTP